MSRLRIPILFAALTSVCLAGSPPVRAEGSAAAPARRLANDGNVELVGIPEIPERIGDRLNRYQNIRSARFLAWADGGGIYVATRFGRVDQIHHVDVPGGARRQITFFDEPVAGAERRPGDSAVSFRMDEGGSEFYQLYLLDPRSGDHRRLTDGASRNGAPLWSRDGGLLAFRSTRRNGRSNDVWILEPGDPEAARPVVEAPDGASWFATDWSRDGRRLLIGQYVGANDSRLHLLERDGGALTLLAGGGDPPATHLAVAPRFDASETGVFLSTDAESEFTRLARLDLATGRIDVLTSDIPWNVDELALSEDRRRAAFVVNEDGIDRLYLFDPATGERRRVESLPAGLIGGLEFSPDGRRLGMTVQTAASPGDAYSLELGEETTADDGATRWTFSELGGLDPATFVEPELVHYPTHDADDGGPRSIPAFLYRPRGEGPHPVIVTIHGGPESQHRPRFSASIQSWVGELGAAVVAPNVRGSRGYGKSYLQLDNGFRREDSVRDIGSLLDWIATRPDLDADRVAVYGGSYGGYMVLASLVHFSDRLRAGVDIVGISNFVTFLENTQDYRRDLRRIEYGDERDPRMRAFLDRISPNRNADRITAPLLVAQGANDPRVPASESEQIVRVVRDAGYDVWAMTARNEGHGFRKKENRDLYQEVVHLFFERHLLGATVPGG